MVDYKFYTDSYYGSRIPQKAFPEMLARAKDALCAFRYRYTVADHGPEAEAMALCAMAEAAYDNAKAPVSYAAAGDVSVRYHTPERSRRALYDAARIYLDIYRAVPRSMSS